MRVTCASARNNVPLFVSDIAFSHEQPPFKDITVKRTEWPLGANLVRDVGNAFTPSRGSLAARSTMAVFISPYYQVPRRTNLIRVLSCSVEKSASYPIRARLPPFEHFVLRRQVFA